MNPDNAFAVVAQSIIDLLTTHSDLFVALGRHLFRGFAVILIAWFGIKAALSAAERGPRPPRSAKFASLLMTIAFGYAMITYYATPIPGIGVSFSHLITDQAHVLAQRLEVAQVQEVEQRLNEVYLVARAALAARHRWPSSATSDRDVVRDRGPRRARWP